jgi:D-glycero-alpha-D-manno-heptose-7-phosphate kinase
LIIRSKAPLRIGLAGGGTDISPYSEDFGGAVLNCTIDLYAHCIIEPLHDGRLIFDAQDINTCQEFNTNETLAYDGTLDLHKGVYNRLVQDYHAGKPLSLKVTTYSDAPPGSGLGSSSTMVVAILKAYVEWLNLPLGEYEIARYAFEIERIEIGLSGGKQDSYAAAFGGFNFMEFKQNHVIVNPLRVKNWIKDELQMSLILFYTGNSRESANIIEEQQKNTKEQAEQTMLAMHELKAYASSMKEAVLKGDIAGFADVLGKSWQAKKRTARCISNTMIEDIYAAAISAGAMAGKVSGAGGGGFMTFVADPLKRLNVLKALDQFNGKVIPFHFSEGGCHGWKIFKGESDTR